MLPREPSLSVQLLWPFARVTGTDPSSASLLARDGIRGAEFVHPDTRVPHRTVVRLLEQAIEATGDPALGLHAAEATLSADLDPVDHAARSCETLGRALACLCRYFPVIDDSAELVLRTSEHPATLSYRVTDGIDEPPAVAEFALARILLFMRRNAILSDESGWEVWFSHPAPPYAAEHRRVLRLPVRFGAPANAIAMPAASLSVPMRHPDARLARSFAVRAEAMMRNLLGQEDVAQRVRRLVVRRIGQGDLSMDAVARRLGASVSTLRRHLAARGTTFRQVVDDVRQQIAEQRLREGSATCSELAFELGFANVAAFHRAFRRWTGLAPSDFRKRHRN